MAIFLLILHVENLQAGKTVTISLNDGVSAWSVASEGFRVPGFSVSAVPVGEIGLANISLGDTTLSLLNGPADGNMIIQIHIEVPDGSTTASGATDTGGDANLMVIYETDSGLRGDLMGDWTIGLG